MKPRELYLKEVISSENETTNLVEDDSEKVSEIISNAQNQPIIIINDPIPVNSIIDGVPESKNSGDSSSEFGISLSHKSSTVWDSIKHPIC
ncbi:hypothetical protein F8M41_022893 [Gigaspora margarita]|uniref:Uncharacterized protein n=1 Tax=Gigaspora margarita TaxID=4874 RepID=A0A8H4EHV9_GIGMA|nr:hypothetical protein F8M41_022893 [Gigaspora margarita]